MNTSNTVDSKTIRGEGIEDVTVYMDTDGISNTVIIKQGGDSLYLDPDSARELGRTLRGIIGT